MHIFSYSNLCKTKLSKFKSRSAPHLRGIKKYVQIYKNSDLRGEIRAKELKPSRCGGCFGLHRTVPGGVDTDYEAIGLSDLAVIRPMATVNFAKSTSFRYGLRSGAQGAELVYLVHSMLPAARLVQGTFEDLDVLCAHNFAMAAKRAGLKQIVYVGGLIPQVPELSMHLRAARGRTSSGVTGVPVTTLRAGMVGQTVHPSITRALGRRYRLWHTVRTQTPRTPLVPTT